MITKEADGRFLHGILLLLILAALVSGAMAISMVKAQVATTSIETQPE